MVKGDVTAGHREANAVQCCEKNNAKEAGCSRFINDKDDCVGGRTNAPDGIRESVQLPPRGCGVCGAGEGGKHPPPIELKLAFLCQNGLQLANNSLAL